MTKSLGELDASITSKIEADTDFQATLADLSDEDKEASITAKKQELLDQEIASLYEKGEKATKAEELANNYKIRAEKAENENKSLKGSKPSAEKSELSPKDYLALTENQVSSDDFDEVIRVSKILDKPISEALKDKTMKQILSDRKEERATANASQTSSRQRSVSNETKGEDLLRHAESTGEIPEDDEGLRKIFQAKMARRFPKRR